ncbi:MAG: right-handed parallel beta-helix repeat-containing protein [Phycisphaerales bacterium]|nr:MAG: right-handed parallel beta-helix repeat-containing protein [Phycisphaerales bacterium]
MKDLIPAALCFVLLNICQGRTITVDDDRPADYNNIQAAIDAAVSGDTVIVSDGFYRGEGNRGLDFDGKAITLQSRNGPLACIIDCQKRGRGFYFHNREGHSSIVDGFTITNGAESQGAGVYCYNRSTPTIINCIIRGNSANSQGGGMCCSYNSGAALANCIIRDNSAEYVGGGVYCYDSTLSIVDSAIINNTSGSYGAGLYSGESSLTLTSSTLDGNAAGYNGGGLYCERSSPIIANCTFGNNTANSRGAGIYCSYDTSPLVTNCTFSGNVAENDAGGIYCGYDTAAVIVNSIFHGNSNHAIYQDYSWETNPVIAYCLFNNNPDGDIWHANTGESLTGASQINALPGADNNIDGSPDFAFGDDSHLMVGSACIDRGTNDPPGGLLATDKDGNARLIDGNGDSVAIVDIGAYEYSPQLPAIALSPTQLEFVREKDGAEPDSQVLRIRNSGGAVLNWSLNHECRWLKVSPMYGDSAGETDEVVVSVETEDLPQGMHTAVLVVNDPEATNDGRYVYITLRIKGTLYVPSQYPTIREAVQAAMESETIEVTGGTYHEYLDLDKTLELVGFDDPVIDAGGANASVISVAADDCIVDGFAIRGGTIGIELESSNNVISNNVVSENENGIELLDSSSENSLTNNRIQSNRAKGLVIYNSQGNTFRQNSISGSLVNFEIDAWSLEQYQQDLDISNTVDEKPIYYMIGQRDVLIDPSSDAGCVFAVNCDGITVTDLTLSNNGRGVSFIGTTNSHIENVVVEDVGRAGIWLEDSKNNTLVGNAVSKSGGGIRLLRSANNTLRNNTCDGNIHNFACRGSSMADYFQSIDTSNTVDGKPIYYLVDRADIVVDASANAGCVFAVDCGEVVVRDLVLSKNGTAVTFVGTAASLIEHVTAKDNSEAGILLFESANNVVKGNHISGNATGIELMNSERIDIEHNFITQNEQGISCSSSEVSVKSSVINLNMGAGGVVFSEQSSATVVNCTIYGNSGQPLRGVVLPGGGVSCDESSSIEVSSCVVWANAPGQIAMLPSMNVTYSDVQGGFTGEGNIDQDPMLTPDGHLRVGSPCTGKGDPQIERTGLDIDGESRVMSRRVDMGADEHRDIDYDGLPDWYEVKYLDPDHAAAPDEDADGDGHTNLDEYELYSSNPAVPCAIYYVDAGRPDDANDGLSWQTAKRTVQSAIRETQNSDKMVVAPGIYGGNVSPEGRQICLQSKDPFDAETISSTILSGTVSVTQLEQQGCVISGLTVANADGTGILCEGTSPTISRCVIRDNRGWYYGGGGGITCRGASPVISECVISGNLSADVGGGIYCLDSCPTITNTVICGNLCSYGYGGRGAAIYLGNSSSMIRNCTIADNGELDEYPYSAGSATYCEKSTLQISNSILRNDTALEIEQRDSTVTVTYSNVKGGAERIQEPWEGKGNIDADPCFVESGSWSASPYSGGGVWSEGDYHLRSEGWRWTPYVTHGSNWVWDSKTSLCIDAGNPGSALDDELLSVPNDPANEWGRNIRINMGAHGGTEQASMAPHNWAVRGDLNNDGGVNCTDLAWWAQDLIYKDEASSADLYRNGSVNKADLALLVDDWLVQTEWCGAVTPIPPQPPLPPEPPGPELPRGR